MTCNVIITPTDQPVEICGKESGDRLGAVYVGAGRYWQIDPCEEHFMQIYPQPDPEAQEDDEIDTREMKAVDQSQGIIQDPRLVRPQ